MQKVCVLSYSTVSVSQRCHFLPARAHKEVLVLAVGFSKFMQVRHKSRSIHLLEYRAFSQSRRSAVCVYLTHRLLLNYFFLFRFS